MSSGTINDFTGISGSSGADVWAVGNSGTIVHLNHAWPKPLGGTCTAPIPIYCGSSLPGGTSAPSPNNFNTYPCAGSGHIGREVYYKFENPVTGQLTATLTPHSGEPDLIAIGATANGSCDAITPTACLGVASQTGTTSTAKQVDLTGVAQGDTIYFVVDSQGVAPSTYTIEMNCIKD